MIKKQFLVLFLLPAIILSADAEADPLADAQNEEVGENHFGVLKPNAFNDGQGAFQFDSFTELSPENLSDMNELGSHPYSSSPTGPDEQSERLTELLGTGKNLPLTNN